ncbi:methylated-DNA--[protein]-cysteine S-methyltransferase [Helicobacter marmotae]|uniref:Methylated-DNA--protein-cysteine methyltransferase n=1 Tax=Helicobacter marmotae TaxID=152490 RepID=A0A3D8I6I9_9HELI|nr:methylated-DNA--[protein]-cysteine S-methyltransferase [Helicobacter marmotae]RDU60779.1 methylated-DNA--[protein]-cysteine S-methyltransferase [Helicobacter marmotae]
MQGGVYTLQWDKDFLHFGIYEQNGYITRIEYNPNPLALAESQKTPLSNECANELQGYFAGELCSFNVPILPQGSAFELRVWRALCEIPYGEVKSYKDIAKAINAPRASRAVGNANHHNPLMILIPCHRVVHSNGTLGGYALGLEFKAKLLGLEQRFATKRR